MSRPRQDRSTPTISQVAQAAGVAPSTVSRAFSRPQMLGKDTVEHILAVAREVGYVPNHTARALSTGRHGNVALIVPDVANPFFPPLIRAAESSADHADFCVFLGNSNERPEREDKLLDRFAGQVEGVVLVSSRLSEARIRHHAARRPIVLVNRDVRGIPRVLIDSGAGIAQAVQHLYGLGHRRFAYVSGPRHSWSNRQRYAGLRRGARDLGFDVATIRTGVPSHAAGRAAAQAVVASGATAVIAFDDLLAQGIMAGLSELGVAVPADVSVIGCDDVLGGVVFPALTTVSSQSAEAGTTALSLLLEVMRVGAMRDASFWLSTHLVTRNSTAAPAEARRENAG